MRHTFTLLVSVLIGVSTLNGQTDPEPVSGERLAGMIAPYVDSGTIGVGYVDLMQLDVEASLDLFVEQLMPLPDYARRDIESGRAKLLDYVKQLREAGARHWFMVFSITDMPGGGPLVVVPDVLPQNPRLLDLLSNHPLPFYWQPPQRSSADIVTGSARAMERWEKGIFRVEERETLAKAFEIAAPAAIRLAIVPSADQRRVFREMLPQVGFPFEELSGEVIADGLIWGAVGIGMPPEPSVHGVLQGEDALAAAALERAINRGIDLIVRIPEVRKAIPMVEPVLRLLRPQHEENRVVWQLDAGSDEMQQLVDHVLAPPVIAARETANRRRKVNSFRQMALAMHNYHDVNKTFPAAAITNEEGKPLLSWRVAVLPYIEQQELYDQFHLDEPWDSPHNKQLIEKMPENYADPTRGDLSREGKTTFQVPVHAETIFPNQSEGLSFKDIKDGTSQTVMIVETAPSAAISWTQPADWRVNSEQSSVGIKTQDRETFIVARADGSVHTMTFKVDPTVFWHLLTAAGGEPIPRNPGKFQR